jgi:hypothetical protein
MSQPDDGELKVRDTGIFGSRRNEMRTHNYSIIQIVLLVLGAALIIGATGFTLTRLDDRTVFTVLVPGAIVGLVLIVIGVFRGGGHHGATGEGG